MGKSVIMVVDDSESTRYLLQLQLKEWGFEVVAVESAPAALSLLTEKGVDLVISDQVMPGMDGLELLHAAKKSYPELPFIILTAHGSISNAVASIRKGADDYLEKPYDGVEMRATIERSLQISRLKKEHSELKEYFSALHGFQAIVTKSTVMQQVMDMAQKVARTPNTTVTIYGESGVGKELLARAIHVASGKIDSRFIAVNCAAIPAGLLESELFGHVKGAFTGADRDREGKFDMAREGTLLLDEIGDMPLALQAKILRVLEEHTYIRVGATTPIKSDFRVITTTNRDLRAMVARGEFREDLYHRISRFPLTIPPLRERQGDIPLLAGHFLDQLRRELGKNLPGITPAAMALLTSYHWPGNVRELKNCMERGAIMTEGESIRPHHLNLAAFAATIGTGEENFNFNISIPRQDFSLEEAVNQIIDSVLARCDGNKSTAAKLLKVDRKLFYRRK